MGLANPAWHLTPGATYNVAFSIDGSVPVYATATALSREQVSLQLADSAQLFNQFRNGYRLEVTSANQTFGFNLEGTAAILSGLINCVNQQLNPTLSNPFAPRLQPPTDITPQQTQSRASHQAEASVVLANVLSAASLQGFRVGSREDVPNVDADAFWAAGDVVGTLNIVDNFGIDDPAIKAGVIGSDAKSCKGKFVSGSLPSTEANGEVRMFTSCEGTDKKTLTVYYLAVPRSKGGIYLFATLATESSNTQGTQEQLRTVDTNLRTAVFQVVK